MPSGSEQLEFDRLKSQWWWLSLPPSTQIEDCAWDWELLRRTETYCKVFDRASKVMPPQRPGRGSPLDGAVLQVFGTWQDVRAQTTANLPLDRNDPRKHWHTLFHAGCDPHLTWPELSTSAQSAIKESPLLFPRQKHVAESRPWYIARITLEKPNGQSESGESTTQVGQGILKNKHSDFKVLPSEIVKLDYIVIQFHLDSVERALADLHQWWENAGKTEPSWWKPFVDNPNAIFTKGTIQKSHAAIYPARQRYWLQAWIPLQGFDDIRKRLHTLLSRREKKKWLPCCIQGWEKEWPQFLALPPALKSKLAKHGAHHLKRGLPAFDTRKAGLRFAVSGFVIQYLKQSLPRLNISPASLRDSLKLVRNACNSIDKFFTR